MRLLYIVVTTFFVIGYLVSIIFFVGHLRRTHYRTWVNLGKPDIAKIRSASIRESTEQLQAFMATWLFIFSNAHASMGDPQLSALVWRLRVLIAGFLFLIFAYPVIPGWSE